MGNDLLFAVPRESLTLNSYHTNVKAVRVTAPLVILRSTYVATQSDRIMGVY